MKKHTILCFSILAVLISSCGNYLDIKPYGKAIPKTAEEFASILHARLNDIDYGEDEDFIGNAASVLKLELFSDNLDATLTLPSGSSLPLYVGSSINDMQNRYERLYAFIRDANIIINNMPASENEEDRKVLGTAYAMRGASYLALLRDFSEPYATDDQLGLSLVTQFDMEDKPLRSTYRQSIQQIESDLKNAIAYKVHDELFRLQEDVAKFYLARLYFWTKDWRNVKLISEELLVKYPLLEGEPYKQMMTAQNEMRGNVFLQSYLFRGSTDLLFTSTQDIIKNRPLSKELVELYDVNDVRTGLFFSGKRINEKIISAKLRSAELFFMLAESQVHLGVQAEALQSLNSFRAKRIQNYKPISMQDLPAVNSESLIQVDAEGKALTPLMQALLNERRMELYGEGDRWYELKRNGRPNFWVANNGLKYETKEYMYTFPIPKVDVELINGLKQNKGYE